MLICMGREVVFELGNGQSFDAPARSGLLHDPSGDSWAKNSLLVYPFKQGQREATDDELSRGGSDYFGSKARVLAGTCALPARSLTGWRQLGAVEYVYYSRAGVRAPGRYRHKFHSPRGLMRAVFALKMSSREPAILYRKGRNFRLELPAGAIVDDRGIVLP